MMSPSERIQQNLLSINYDIHSACSRAGREYSAVKLVAVTKYAEWPWVEALSKFQRAFGENRPQQLSERQPLLPHVEWHLIGQLQRNKVRLALEHAALIHSVGSLKLLKRIYEVATELRIRPRVLLQMNMSVEISKSGFAVQELVSAWPEIVRMGDSVHIDGLMTMAAEAAHPEDARPAFRSLRILRDHLITRDDSRNAGLMLPELSMGMSGDFVPAIEEGATLVRIGSRVFMGLQPI